MNKPKQTELGALDSLALSKAFAHGFKKDFPSEIPVGIYTGTAIIKVDWELSKDAPTEKKPTSKLLSKGVIAKAMVIMGIQADNFLAALKTAAEFELLNSNNADVAKKLGDDDKRLEEKLEQLDAEVLSKLPKTPVSGKVTVDADITVLTDEDLREMLAEQPVNAETI